MSPDHFYTCRDGSSLAKLPLAVVLDTRVRPAKWKSEIMRKSATYIWHSHVPVPIGVQGGESLLHTEIMPSHQSLLNWFSCSLDANNRFKQTQVHVDGRITESVKVWALLTVGQSLGNEQAAEVPISWKECIWKLRVRQVLAISISSEKKHDVVISKLDSEVRKVLKHLWRTNCGLTVSIQQTIRIY